MKYLISIIIVLIFTSAVYAAPFRCDMAGGIIFADRNQCNAVCTGETGQKSCEELEPSPNANTCNTSKYRGFVAVGGKTYAVTKQPVTWGAEKTAIIGDANINKTISKLLKSLGVQSAWIGATDRNQSNSYNNIDPSRFSWRDGSQITYSNWRSGEPNNAFDASLIGVVPVYGEHWATISSDGYWQDLGYNTNGTERRLPAVVEFNGTLSCVSGRPKDTSASDAVKGMVCAGSQDAGGMIQLKPCETGLIFDTANTGYLCSEGKTACVGRDEIAGQECKDVYVTKKQIFTGSFPFIGGNRKEKTFMSFDGVVVSYARAGLLLTNNYTEKLDGELISSEITVHPYRAHNTQVPGFTMKESFSGLVISPEGALGVTYTITAQVKVKTIECTDIIVKKYTCPYSGRPCIENKGGYYCSPNDCLNGSDEGNYTENENEAPEGSNDADNNGQVDDNGNCLGKLVIFPGNDKRCRTVGLQTKGFQCCKIIKSEDADKPDIVIFPDALDFDVCNGSERSLAVSRAKDMCVTIGKYCSESWRGFGCVQHKYSYCCFDSDFSRAFNEAGMDMLGKSWGTPENPNCGGFSPEELQTLSAMNISNHPKIKEYADKLGAEFSDKLMNEFENNFKTPEFQQDIKEQIKDMEK